MERDLLSRSAGATSRPGGGFDELTFYAEHFDTVEINSTFYRVPAPAAAKGWVERTPPGFEFSLKLFQKFTHPRMFEKATGKDPWDLAEKDVDEFRAGIDPIASAGKLGALLAQFPSSFRNEPSRAPTWSGCWSISAITRSRSNSAIAAGAISPKTRCGCSTRSAPRGRRSTSRSSGSQSARICSRTCGRSTTCASTAETPRSGGTTTIRGPLQLPVFGRGAPADCRGRAPGIARGEEGLSLRQQSFLGEVGRQCRDPETRSRPAAAGRVPAGVRRSLPGPERPCQGFCRPLLH